ncbi:MAG: hypothetical protein JWQ29_1646, partial [Phenylobacterium sp.]|nr:hypothetical protein [Phenylobacterium sp.]
MSSRSASRLTPEIASSFARIALSHVTREYPVKMDHVIGGPDDVRGQRDLHPIFFGSFDWHSCVHSHWLLASLLRREPAIPEAAAIRAHFDQAFTAQKVAAETAYVRLPSSRGFVRPNGWGWLLKLQSELLAHEDLAYARNLQPLADAFADRFREFLPRADYPIRTGVHSSSSFAMALGQDYAVAGKDAELTALFTQKARAWHLSDRDAPAWEPSGDDFLSATLVTAVALRRLLPAGEFVPWLRAYLPRAAQGEPATLFTPARVSDRTDGKIAHLDGLNLSRAWCWRGIASSLPAGHAAREVALQAADT